MINSLISSYDPHWRKILSKLVNSKQHQKALSILDNLITNDLPLFKDSPYSISERNIALLLKIDLLRKLNRDLDALAWLCLECDLHPSNNLAQLLRDQLKYKLNLNILSQPITEIFEKHKFVEDTEWPDVAGMTELKLELNNFLIKPINNPMFFSEYKIHPPNGALFYGPSGCGKTFLARKIAEKIGYNFIEIKPSDLGSVYIHGSQEKIAELFKKAIKDAPMLLFFDEFDALAPNRDNTSHHYKSEVNEFLVQLDNLHQKDVLIVVATNRALEIDKAILRPGRIDLKIFFPPPDLEARIETLILYMKGRPQQNINWNQLGDYTENYTYAELKSLVDHCVIYAANNSKKVTTEDFIEYILKHPALLKDDDIDKMKKEPYE